MKSKLLQLSKTLLVVVCLLVGASSAWADDTKTLLECGTSNAPWTAESLTAWTGTAVTISGDNSYVQFSGTNNSDFATTTTITPTKNAIVKLSAVWRGRSNNGRYFADNCGIYFRYGNIVVTQNDQDQSHGYVLTGIANLSNVTTFKTSKYRVDIADCAWLKIEAEINTASNILTSFTIKSEDGTTTYVNLTDVALADPDYTTVAFGFQRGKSHTNEKQEQLKSVVITETAQEVSTAEYTINYLLNGEGEPVKTVTGEGAVGSSVNTDASFFEGDVKYFRADGQRESVTIAANNNVFNINVRLANTYNYEINAVNQAGKVIKNLKSISGLEGERS